MDNALYGTRIPRHYFIKTAYGVSEESSVNAFDQALAAMGIAHFNITKYSSIIPPDAVLVEPPDPRETLNAWGGVLEGIVSHMHGESGEVIGAAIGTGWLKDKSGHRAGGMAVEVRGNFTEGYLREEAIRRLEQMAKDRIEGKSGLDLILDKDSFQIHAISREVPENRYGYVLAGIYFLSWEWKSAPSLYTLKPYP